MCSNPSSKSGIISVPASLRDSLSCLDIVWSDMFETEDINPEEARKHEADFLKGAPLQWLTLVEKENSPLVKRDGFSDLKQLIERKRRKQCLVTDVSLRYQPGSGGSTLAMQVLWDFRKDLRCARVIDSNLDTKELSKQVVDLFLLSSEERAKQDRKTVLLLLDTKEKINDLPIKNVLWENLIDEIRKRGINTNTPVVIVLNCIPTDFTRTDTMILSSGCSEEEIKTFKEQLFQQIRLQRKGHWEVTIISLLYHKDSSGSALAGEVLSDLSETFICETWTEPFKTDNTENKEIFGKKIEKMVNELHALYETHQNTVLLLLDHKDTKPQPNFLRNLLSKLQRPDQADHPAFIVINAVSKNAVPAKDDVKLKMELLPDEKNSFAQKRLEIDQKKLSQTFHAFNIMWGGFQKEDVEKLITEEMITYVKNHKESSNTRLLSFLALINSYVPGSHLSKLFCQEFMDQTDEENPTLETKMKPFMDLIVIFSEGEQEDQCVRLAHPMIADACLKMFTESKLMRSDIALDFLNSLVKGKESDLGKICKKMLVVRLEILMEKDKFSRLILDIIRENNDNHCIRLLEVASELFSEDPFYPQTLARLFYIVVKKDNKYEEARKWAKKAIERDPNNSHIRDTLGQVHKNHLLNETKKPFIDRKACLSIAQSAIKAFKDEEKAAEDESGDDTKFNNRGLFGFLQVCKIIHPKMPFEHSEQEYINGLKGDVETKYDFFEWFLAFSRQSFEKEDPDYIRRDVEECYMHHFETDKITLGEKKMYSGELLRILKSDIDVLKQYKGKIENPQTDNEIQTVLYILANIICSESGEQFQKIQEYQSCLHKLWLREMQERRPEFYLLVLLLFWPDDMQPRIRNPPNLEKCLRKMRHSYKTKYQKYLHSRYLVPLFFFAKGKGLQKLVHTSKLRQTDLELLAEGDGNVEIKDLQRISGQVRKHQVFAIRGDKEIRVASHNRASVCKQGQVSFYLGFNIRGPVAYNIRYTDSSGAYYMKAVNEKIRKK
ncbi:sterile alpha motif domain-containing protein 9-like [Puntigrus tetrazona]|uniref:sterile alpha motif domain-containing protein 9-like n=1 Tax=Puntigrus tetrazona TaxID=1606681 RepID=UPI001C8A4A72|nr:sterile alpha motif domain-containing protein 9-like [Puntigrus tetrazona]XP_043099046.1 sterile alpha motif domain-containing protein 9-like [Puntigrus tetrazona]